LLSRDDRLSRGPVPDNIAYGATGGPEFATTAVATGAGHEKRNVNWAQSRYGGRVAFARMRCVGGQLD
jgi:uncharacterized protein (TIGR02217 family)